MTDPYVKVRLGAKGIQFMYLSQVCGPPFIVMAGGLEHAAAYETCPARRGTVVPLALGMPALRPGCARRNRTCWKPIASRCGIARPARAQRGGLAADRRLRPPAYSALPIASSTTVPMITFLTASAGFFESPGGSEAKIIEMNVVAMPSTPIRIATGLPPGVR